MTELIFGTEDLINFEIIKSEIIPGGAQKFQNKTISIDSLIELLNEHRKKNVTEHEEVILHINTLKDRFNLLGYKKTNKKEEYIYDFKEMYIKTFYNDVFYEILHPNAIIKIDVDNNKIINMYIYIYKKFEGVKTKLYANPFPNMYGGNATCMGSANRTIKDSNCKTILSILETSYTHSNTGFKNKKLKDTKKAFEYLSKNKFPYGSLYSLNKTLKSIL